MKEGWLSRSFTATLPNKITIKVDTKRFLSLSNDELGAIEYQVTPINSAAKITFQPYLDSGITNEDTNWDDAFWNTKIVTSHGNQAFIEAHTMKTNFHTCTFMQSECFVNGDKNVAFTDVNQSENKISFSFSAELKQDETFTIHKFGGYVVDRNHDKNQLVLLQKKL